MSSFREQTSSPSWHSQKHGATVEQSSFREAALERLGRPLLAGKAGFCARKGKSSRRRRPSNQSFRSLERELSLSPQRRCLHSPPALSLPATPRPGSAGRAGRPKRDLLGQPSRPLCASTARRERRSFVFLLLSFARRHSSERSEPKGGKSKFFSSSLLWQGQHYFFFFFLLLRCIPSLRFPSPVRKHTTMRAAALAPSPRSVAVLSAAPRRASAVAPLAAKPTKAADFRGLSNEEIDAAVAESKRALFDMRIAQKTRQVWLGQDEICSPVGSAEGERGASGANRKGRHPVPLTSTLTFLTASCGKQKHRCPFHCVHDSSHFARDSPPRWSRQYQF